MSSVARIGTGRLLAVYYGALGAIMLGYPPSLGAQSAAEAESLSKALKPILVQSIPAVLYDKSENWGHQAMVPVGVKWHGLRPSVTRAPRNHGLWKKLIITSQELPRTLDLKLSDFKNIDKERQTFKVFFTFQMGVLYEHQTWENGARIWSGSVRARAQVQLALDCENTLRVDLGKDLLPDFILRIRVLKADVRYDKLVVEHVNGMGGTWAKLVGQAVHDCLHQWQPSIERDVLTKASTAIVQSADTREIRIGFGSLLKGQ